ncbi:hypothetical protein B9Z55_011255 [Caenorhabditis nigoni]|uniref:F-box domain-containing protein n=1 Tax=Caenorhabditis nigoni TaxID=1611254 RepID=A0A2G5UJA8_9PELO|nr:hypothetical protein B9Z55_011255 [Caenorhabditis nigoni]
MTNLRFPFRRLPDDLGLMVLKTLEHHEIIAYSLTSKKALSLVQSLGVSLGNAQIRMNDWPNIYLDFGNNTVQFNWTMDVNGEDLPDLDEIPIDVDVSAQKIDDSTVHIEPFTWSNQGKSIGEWIQHICSIFLCELYEADFHIGNMRYDVQSLRNAFPKLRKIGIYFFTAEPSEHDIQRAQNILRAFLPCVKHFRLYRVPLQEDFSIQHIGMANLKELEIYYPRNPKLEDLLTLNAERCTILENQFSLRVLNRFFKLWKKGSNRKLKHLLVHGNNGIIPSKDVLLKGLQAEGEMRGTVYTIKNCVGMCGRITILDNTRQFSLRDLNRVFKLWKKGSFPKLKNLMVLGETIPDWSVLLKGLQAEETEREIEYTIRNCYGILAKINTDFTTLPTINFLVLN